MARRSKQVEKVREKTLYTAAELFLEKGYTETTMRGLAQKAGVDVSGINRAFGCKENILCELVTYVLNGQFETMEALLQGVTDDPLLFYAAETTMQLYMAESGEQIRNLYLAAYSMPRSIDIIHRTITEKLEKIFKAHLPHLQTRDFYELEIASGGVMRSFMARPCDMYFTMERKVNRFLETTFRIYQVSNEKIQEAIDFVQQFDFPDIAKNTIDRMLQYLKESIE